MITRIRRVAGEDTYVDQFNLADAVMALLYGQVHLQVPFLTELSPDRLMVSTKNYQATITYSGTEAEMAPLVRIISAYTKLVTDDEDIERYLEASSRWYWEIVLADLPCALEHGTFTGSDAQIVAALMALPAEPTEERLRYSPGDVYLAVKICIESGGDVDFRLSCS